MKRVARAISFEPGMPAPTMRGEAIDGRVVDLVDFRPRAVLLEFFRGTW